MNRVRESRSLDVYEDTMRAVDEIMGVPVDEWCPPKPSASSTPVAQPRGARRGEKLAREKQEKMLSAAMIQRKREIRQHTEWLRSSGKRVVGNERSTKLKLWDQPGAVPSGASIFRREVNSHCKRKVRNQVTGHGASIIVLRKPSFVEGYTHPEHGGTHVCSSTLLSRFASHHLKYQSRFAALAATLRVVYARHNRLPGHGRIMALLGHLRTTAGENPDPARISRSQFVRIAVAALDGLTASAANLLYASFDPEHTDRVPCGAIIAALLAGHRSNDSLATFTMHNKEGGGIDHETEVMLRNAVAAYDPENDGIEQVEITQLLSVYTTSHNQHLTMSRLLQGSDWTNALEKQSLHAGLNGRLRADDLIFLLKNNSNVLDELLCQLQAFREKLEKAQIAQAQARSRSAARANESSYSYD